MYVPGAFDSRERPAATPLARLPRYEHIQAYLRDASKQRRQRWKHMAETAHGKGAASGKLSRKEQADFQGHRRQRRQTDLRTTRTFVTYPR